MSIFVRSSHLPVSREEAFAWHARPGAFQRLLPPWENISIQSQTGSIYDGDELSLAVEFGVLSIPFSVVHQNYIHNQQFEDKQTQGPFAEWTHTHLFEPLDETRCKIIDRLQYELPFGPLGASLQHVLLENRLDRLFAYRHRTLGYDLYLHKQYTAKKLTILVTGSSGFVGSHLVPFLTAGGHRVLCLVREDIPPNGEDDPDVVYWDTHNARFVNSSLVENLDAVIHLAGAGIAERRWTSKRKSELVHSRVHFTQELCAALRTLKTPPKTFISASGIGIFGKRNEEEVLTEKSPVGSGFLAQLAKDWEAASRSLEEVGTRLVHMRFGAVISSAGGMLKALLGPYKLWLGGPLGSGRQMVPWISLVDVLGLMAFSLHDERVKGPIHAVSPQVVSNEQFSKILAQVLDRSSALRIPESLVQLLLGEMGEELLLSGQNARPQKALELGYEFLQPRLQDALNYYLGH